MFQLASGQERPRVNQGADDRIVRLSFVALVRDDALADKARRFVSEGAILVDRVGNARVHSAVRQEPGIGCP